jgi:hypothetical protein
VKISHYNEKMHRIELIASLFEKAAAAQIHGPRARIADIELEKLATEHLISTSMGCLVSHDSCSYCGHKSKNPKEYCDERTCKAGGLKKHMGALLSDGSFLHADNPDPDFNDISHVGRGADRISYVMGVLRKSASTDPTEFISGARLAELIYTLDDPDSPRQCQCNRLADRDSNLAAYAKYAAACSPVGRPQAFWIPDGITDSRKLVQACAALADQQIVLPVEEFLELVAGQKCAAVAVRQELPGIFERLDLPVMNPFTCLGEIPIQYQTWAARLAPSFSLEKQAVSRRIGIATLRGQTVMLAPRQKYAAVNKFAEELAQNYALYVLAALDRNQGRTNLGLTEALCLLQNQIHRAE